MLPNEVPQLRLERFASYRVDGHYRKVYDSPARLNYGEFWVRVGEAFQLNVQLDDDAGLRSYTINRLPQEGSPVEVYREDFAWSCPQAAVVSASPQAEIVFLEDQPTEYEIVVTDNYDQSTRQTFLVLVEYIDRSAECPLCQHLEFFPEMGFRRKGS